MRACVCMCTVAHCGSSNQACACACMCMCTVAHCGSNNQVCACACAQLHIVVQITRRVHVHVHGCTLWFK